MYKEDEENPVLRSLWSDPAYIRGRLHRPLNQIIPYFLMT